MENAQEYAICFVETAVIGISSRLIAR